MPFTNQETYRGGSYIAEGLGNLGAGIKSSLERYQEMHQQEVMVDLLSQMERPDPNDPEGKKTIPLVNSKWLNAYKQERGIRRAAMAGGIMGSLDMFQRMQEAASRVEETKAQIEERRAHADYYRREKERADRGEQQPTMIDPFVDPASGNIVPGIGIVRKTGGVVYPGQLADPNQPRIRFEEGVPYTVGPKGETKIQDPRDLIIARKIFGQSGAGPTPAPTATPAPTPGLKPVARRVGDTWQISGIPDPRAAAAPAATPTAGATGLPAGTRVIEKNGHHYLVNDATRQVIGQID